MLVRTAPLVSRWIERVLAAHAPPLTLVQYLTLQAVADGEVVGAELARRTAVSPAAISQIAAALEAAALLRRDTPTGDRRSRPLALTEQGRATLASAGAALREQLAELLADMPPAEAAALTRVLGRLESSLGSTPPPPRPRRPGPPLPRGPRRPKGRRKL